MCDKETVETLIKALNILYSVKPIIRYSTTSGYDPDYTIEKVKEIDNIAEKIITLLKK